MDTQSYLSFIKSNSWYKVKGFIDKTLESNPKDVVIPSVIDHIPIEEITGSAFCGTNITSIFIPSTIKTIGNQAFFSCHYIKKIVFGEKSNLEFIGLAVFAFCYELIYINIPQKTNEFRSISSYQNIYDDRRLTCISYLGLTAFTDQYLINKYNSRLIIHLSKQYPGQSFGNIPISSSIIRKDGKNMCFSKMLKYELIENAFNIESNHNDIDIQYI